MTLAVLKSLEYLILYFLFTPLWKKAKSFIENIQQPVVTYLNFDGKAPKGGK